MLIVFLVLDKAHRYFQTTRSEYDDSEYSVRRRYNDFLWLRQRLEETYPTHLVPVSLYSLISDIKLMSDIIQCIFIHVYLVIWRQWHLSNCEMAQLRPVCH